MDVCLPEFVQEPRLGFVSSFSLYPLSSWYYSHVGQLCSRPIPQAVALSLGQRLRCHNDHFKYFPECFHTLCAAQVGLQLSAPGKAQPELLRISTSLDSVTTCSLKSRSKARAYISLYRFTCFTDNLLRLCTIVHGHYISTGVIFKRLCLLTL